jgi:hypothetical protein
MSRAHSNLSSDIFRLAFQVKEDQINSLGYLGDQSRFMGYVY